MLTTILVLVSPGYACRDNGLLLAITAPMWSAALPLLAEERLGRHGGRSEEKELWC